MMEETAPVGAPETATEKVTSKSLWAEIVKVSANYSGLQWRTMAISVLLLAKGAKEVTIRDKLAKSGITWGSKVVTMATRFTDGVLTEEDQKAIFAMDTEAAVADVDRRLGEHRKLLNAKSMDEYYPVCGMAAKDTASDAMIKRVREKRKANATKVKAPAPEPEVGEAEEEEAETPTVITSITDLESVKNKILALSDTDMAAFAKWFSDLQALAAQEPEAIAA